MKTTDEEIKQAQLEADFSKCDLIVSIELSLLQLMAVHGACCLGLRHPDFKGLSRSLVLQFVEMAEKKFIKLGMFKSEHIALIHKVEAEETEPNQ